MRVKVGRGLAFIAGSVDSSIGLELDEYSKESKDRLFTAISNNDTRSYPPIPRPSPYFFDPCRLGFLPHLG